VCQYGVNIVHYADEVVCGATQNKAKISDIEDRISVTNPDQVNFKILFLLIFRPCVLHRDVFWNSRHIAIVNDLLDCNVFLYQIDEWRICMRKIA